MRRPWCCAVMCWTAETRSPPAWPGGVWIKGTSSRRSIGWQRRAAERSRPLVVRTKATLRASESLLDADEAVALELAAQTWSMEQPGFDDRVRAIQDAVRNKAEPSKTDSP